MQKDVNNHVKQISHLLHVWHLSIYLDCTEPGDENAGQQPSYREKGLLAVERAGFSERFFYGALKLAIIAFFPNREMVCFVRE
jgi:hypothetical protein